MKLTTIKSNYYSCRRSDGFTLIELLVVIAIIGLLSSIVLVSLNSARTKARDASIKFQLSMMRTAGELIYDSIGTFDTICSASSDTERMFRNAYNNGMKNDAESVCLASNTTVLWSTGGVLVSATKTATPDKWAASIRLWNGNFFCVDYKGSAQEQSGRGIDNSPLDVDC